MNTYNLFISHTWKYNNGYYKVVDWLDSAVANKEFNYKNYSVPQHDPIIDPDTNVGKNQLKELLKIQIRPASAVIILSGMYTAYSEWIDFEIDTAISMKKHIIGIKPWGQERIPKKIQDNCDQLVGWNSQSLISAIKNI